MSFLEEKIKCKCSKLLIPIRHSSFKVSVVFIFFYFFLFIFFSKNFIYNQNPSFSFTGFQS